MTKTLVGILVMVGVALAFEFWTVAKEGVPTISEVVLYLGSYWNPFVIYIIGVLYGHWALSPDFSLAKYIGETGELFIVVWIGWIIFWYFYGNQQLLPLSTLERSGVVLFSILVGAFVWTIESNVWWIVK